MLILFSGCEPLTPDDIAEVVVFTAGRRENVVIADTLIFPNHQVSIHPLPILVRLRKRIEHCIKLAVYIFMNIMIVLTDNLSRLLRPSCTRNHNVKDPS